MAKRNKILVETPKSTPPEISFVVFFVVFMDKNHALDGSMFYNVLNLRIFVPTKENKFQH